MQTAFQQSYRVRQNLPRPDRIMAPVWWYGGKGQLAKWIVPLLPRGQVYVEPFCGAASVFWHLPKPYPVEVLNDLDHRIITLFRALQDPETFEHLAHRITWTLFSLDEFRRALDILRRWEESNVIDRAWAVMVAYGQGFNGTTKTVGSWGRVFVSVRGMASNSNGWRSRMALLDNWHARLTRVQLDSRPALEVIRYWDSENVVFYLDPPYLPETRVNKAVYEREMSMEEHTQLIQLLLNIRGKVVLSGYKNPVYEALEHAGWRRLDRRVICYAAGRTRNSGLQGDGALIRNVSRLESVWLNPAAYRSVHYSKGFGVLNVLATSSIPSTKAME